MDSIEIYVDGSRLPGEIVQAWEKKRALTVHRKLLRTIGLRQEEDSKSWSLERLRKENTDVKVGVGRNGLRAALMRDIKISGAVTKLIVLLSRGRRKQCVTEIFFQGIPAKEVFERIDDLMLHDNAVNNSVNLNACPDHYVLEPHDGTTLEVVETTGGSPFAAQFFLRYGDGSGLISTADPLFPYQSFGTARSKDGLSIGGIRHQFRDIGPKVNARLMVEFPAATPNFMIKQHQLHLACEFTNWINQILETPGFKSRQSAKVSSRSALPA